MEHVEDVVLSLLNVVSAWISTELDPVLQRQLNLNVEGWSKALLAPQKVWHLPKFWDDRG